MGRANLSLLGHAGGANGARTAGTAKVGSQQPDQLARVLSVRTVAADSGASIADVIVLGYRGDRRHRASACRSRLGGVMPPDQTDVESLCVELLPMALEIQSGIYLARRNDAG